MLYLLVLLLLFAQQGAAMHGISHIGDAAQQEQQLPHDQFCDQCSAYSQIGGAAPQGHSVFAASASGGRALPAEAAFAYPSLNALAFLPRAPPILD